MTAITHRARDLALAAAARMKPSIEQTGDTIVVLQPDHLGDIILSQPAVRLLRQSLPDKRIVAVVGPWSRDIAHIAWPVDDVLTLEYPGFTRRASGDPTGPYRQVARDAESLRRLNPEAGLVLRPDAWWAAWVAALAMAEVVTGDDPATRRFATRSASIPCGEHAVVRAAAIAAAYLGVDVPSRVDLQLSIPPQAHAVEEVANLLKEHGVNGPYAVMHPGSGADVKLWTESRWRVVARELSNRGMAVVLTGSGSEREMCEAIAEETDARVLAGQTNVAVLAELFRDAALAIGTDNGPMHLAVAVDTPSVHLFGPSDPTRYGPWGDQLRHRVLHAGWHCPRCGDLSAARSSGCGCMLAITGEMVISALDLVLDARGPG